MRVKVANWRNCLLDVSKCSLKIVLRCSNDLCLIPFVTSWKLFRSHAVTRRWLDDCKECIQSGWKQTTWLPLLGTRNPSKGCFWFSKAAFLENYFPVSTWTFDESLIEWHEKKHQPFSLFDVRFGSRVIQISGWKSAWQSKMTFPPLPPV